MSSHNDPLGFTHCSRWASGLSQTSAALYEEVWKFRTDRKVTRVKHTQSLASNVMDIRHVLNLGDDQVYGGSRLENMRLNAHMGTL